MTEGKTIGIWDKISFWGGGLSVPAVWLKLIEDPVAAILMLFAVVNIIGALRSRKKNDKRLDAEEKRKQTLFEIEIENLKKAEQDGD